jgi:hypothetical protein
MKAWILLLTAALLSACGGGSGDSGGPSGVVIFPLAPSNLNTKVDNTGVTVGWLGTLGGDSYNLYYSTDPGFTVANYSVYANAGLKVDANSPLKISDLGNGPVYYFRATTVDDGKEGSPTQIVHAVTRYAIAGPNGEFVKDKITGLEWKRCSLGQTWNAAAGSCDGVATKFTTAQTTPKFTVDAEGWRVPTRDEMLSLVFCDGSGPAAFVVGAKVCDVAGADPAVMPFVVTEVFPQTPTDRPFQVSTTLVSGDSTAYCVVPFGAVGSVEACAGDTTGTQRLPNYIRLVRTSLLP